MRQKKERMAEAIGFWHMSYENGWFVRLSIIDKAISSVIGTVELCLRVSEDEFNNIAGTLLYARDHRIEDLEGFQKYVGSVDSNRKDLLKSIKAAELRLTEIAALKKHIINYSKTRPIYEAYRKAGYSKQFLAAHREEIEIHKAAKNAFCLLESKIPTVKELSSEYAELLSQKKETYLEYRKLSSEYEQARVYMQNYSAMVNLKEANDQPQPTPEDSKSVR